jgi:hypothetical protein
MSRIQGVRVTVESDLPEEVVARLADAVRATVLQEVAQLDLAPALHQVPLESSDFSADVEDLPGFEYRTDGIWLRDDDR